MNFKDDPKNKTIIFLTGICSYKDNLKIINGLANKFMSNRRTFLISKFSKITSEGDVLFDNENYFSLLIKNDNGYVRVIEELKEITLKNVIENYPTVDLIIVYNYIDSDTNKLGNYFSPFKKLFIIAVDYVNKNNIIISNTMTEYLKLYVTEESFRLVNNREKRLMFKRR